MLSPAKRNYRQINELNAKLSHLGSLRENIEWFASDRDLSRMTEYGVKRVFLSQRDFDRWIGLMRAYELFPSTYLLEGRFGLYTVKLKQASDAEKFFQAMLDFGTNETPKRNARILLRFHLSGSMFATLKFCKMTSTTFEKRKKKS